MKTLGDASGKFYMSKNIRNEFSDELLLENQIAKKKQEEEEKEMAKLLLDASKRKQEEINNKLQTLEMLPIGNRIIISAYPENPYRKVIQGSIIVDYDGSFINPDTGEKDKMKDGITCGEVIEVGPDCKYIKPGDDVYFIMQTCVKLPFMSLGYVSTNEPNVIAVLNEGLKQRFKME